MPPPQLKSKKEHPPERTAPSGTAPSGKMPPPQFEQHPPERKRKEGSPQRSASEKRRRMESLRLPAGLPGTSAQQAFQTRSRIRGIAGLPDTSAAASSSGQTVGAASSSGQTVGQPSTRSDVENKFDGVTRPRLLLVDKTGAQIQVFGSRT